MLNGILAMCTKHCPVYIPRSEGCVKLAKIRQLVSNLGQEASLCTIHGEVSVTRDRVIVFQPWDDGGQELNLTLSITGRFEIVDPDGLALGLRGDVVDGVFEILLAIDTGSPEPVNAQEANGAAGRVAQVEEFGKPHHVGRVLEVARSSERDTLTGIWLHVRHPSADSCLWGNAGMRWLAKAHEVLVTCSYTLFGVAGP